MKLLYFLSLFSVVMASSTESDICRVCADILTTNRSDIPRQLAVNYCKLDIMNNYSWCRRLYEFHRHVRINEDT